MMGDNRRLSRLRAFLVGSTLLSLGSTPARAQCGWGLGWLGGFNYASSPTSDLNNWSLSNGSRAGAPVSGSPYAGNFNAYYKHVRDHGLATHDAAQGRQPPAERPRPSVSLASRVDRQEKPSTTLATSRPKPVIPLSSFFDADDKLTWPSEAPSTGSLKEKREASDQACLAVLEESRQFGAASIVTVTTARQKLLDYGRPALQEVRSRATPRVADSFHVFLLSLYKGLDRATSPTETSAEHGLQP